MLEIYGAERKVVLARERTKLYEQVFRDNLFELNDRINPDSNHQKDELVLMFDGHAEETNDDAIQILSEDLSKILLDKLPVEQAASFTAKEQDKKMTYIAHDGNQR